MNLIEAVGIQYYIKDKLLLDIEHVKIEQNARIGLVGVNGSGKSTLINILHGSLKPDTGHIHRCGSSEVLSQLVDHEQPKSGGEITQENVQEKLLLAPELLFADEPTSNLDTSHIEWVEKRLKNYQGALVIVSHDRAFLDSICTVIWELEDQKIKVYKGNYSTYQQQKLAEKERQMVAYEKYEAKRKQLEKALKLKKLNAEKTTKVKEIEVRGSKPHFAKKQKKLYQSVKAIESRIKNLERVERVKEIPQVKMDLPNEDYIKGKMIARLESVSCKVGSKILWKPATFYIKGGDKLAILGPNGSGKSTLVNMVIEGAEGVSVSPHSKIGYFRQDLMTIDDELSVLENVQSSSVQHETLIRTVLARLHFYGDDVYKKVGVLSGGERVKVSLAKLFVSDINTLILDEPTNFLDIQAVTALQSLLQEYDGTVLFVSHDRRFVEQVANRILRIENQELVIYEGGYQEVKENARTNKQSIINEELMVIENRIIDVLSRLSLEPSEELENEFQKLLAQKRLLKD